VDDPKVIKALIRTGVGALVREGTPVLKVVQEADEANEASRPMLDEIVRDGARAMLAAALQAEVAAYIDAHAVQLGADGHRLVVRNGYHDERVVMTAAGAVPVRAPRVNDKRVDEATGERVRFASAILPTWARKSPTVAEVLPLLYLHGLSSGDFGPALEQFLGSGAGLSASTVTRLTAQWQEEAATFNVRSLKDSDYVYVWVDGIHVKVRLEQEKVCLLVILGVRADGRKSSSRSPTASVNPPSPGRTCCVRAKGVGCAHRCSRSAMGRWDSGRRSGTCSPTPPSSAAGGIMPTFGLCRCGRRFPCRATVSC
jgi:hypothetical protein